MADLTTQLIEQVQSAASAGTKLRIEGGGTKAFMGRATTAEQETISLKEHTGIVSYQPVELVMTARAGTPLVELKAALDEQNQMLAFEPPVFSASSTLGGTLATNQSGPGRPWWGSVRDHVLGVRLINGKAEHLRFGGQVMKNVAGYDVSRLQAGAFGGLGVISEISLKVLPKPAMQRTLVTECTQPEALSLMNQRAGEPKPITAATWYQGKLYTRLAGAASAVSAAAAAWGGEELEHAEDFWLALANQQHEFFSSDAPLWRFSVNSKSPAFNLSGATLIDWGGSQRWYAGEQDWQQMVSIASHAGGQVSLYRGGDRSAEVLHPQAEAIQKLQQRLKASFDPAGIFNPGRAYSWL